MMAQYGTLYELLKNEVKDGSKDELLLSKWSRGDDQFMSIACLAALRSKDPRTPVGACIVDASKKVVGIGYNSMPHIQSKEKTDTQSDGQTIVKQTDRTQLDGTSNKKTDDNDNIDVFPWSSGSRDSIGCSDQRDEYTKHPYVCHAAMNAIVGKTIPDLTNCTIYLTQHPDEDCANIIVQSGIKEVKYQRNTNRGNKIYERNAKRILQLYGVSIQECNPKTEVSIYLIRKDRELSLNLCDRINKVPKDAKPDVKAKCDDYITWEELFMGLALLEHVYSNDGDTKPTVKVGACLVNSSKQVLAIGGSSASEDPEMLGNGIVDKRTGSLPTIDQYAHHAEYKTIASYKGVKDIKGCTLYVTRSPCNVCAKLIAQSGINEVVYKEEIEDKTKTIFKLSKIIFKNCNILCRQLKFVEKVAIMKTNKPKPFPLEWKKSTVFECKNLQKYAVDDLWYYSLNVESNLDVNTEYHIDSLDIYTSATLQEGDIQVILKFSKFEEIGSCTCSTSKRAHITKDYEHMTVDTSTHLFKVKENLVNIEKKTLKDEYQIYFDIFCLKKSDVFT